MKSITKALLALSILTLLSMPVQATMSPEELAAESEAYTKTTEKTTPTMPETIIAKVEEACTLVSAEGQAAFPKFKGKSSPFLYEGTYIWIHSLKDGIMLMHPIKNKMEGINLIGLKDKNGKRFFVTMNDLATQAGKGWVEYMWPTPGTNEVVRKVSYVKKCTLPDSTEIVIGSGIYNGDQAAMAKLDIK
ncbi:MAG: cache domain-containing protein [Pseudomonadota bacterium]